MCWHLIKAHVEHNVVVPGVMLSGRRALQQSSPLLVTRMPASAVAGSRRLLIPHALRLILCEHYCFVKEGDGLPCTLAPYYDLDQGRKWEIAAKRLWWWSDFFLSFLMFPRLGRSLFYISVSFNNKLAVWEFTLLHEFTHLPKFTRPTQSFAVQVLSWAAQFLSNECTDWTGSLNLWGSFHKISFQTTNYNSTWSK